MPSNFDEAFAAVKSLAKDFDAHKGHYLSPAYKEAEVRIAFIDKFLIALGWDVRQETQKTPGAQEVKVEPDASKGGSERRADYAFYIAPRFQKDDVRFFVEAKKPFGEIGTPDNCFQTLGYGFSAETPLAVLTDFEQFHILDCRYKPTKHTATAQTLRKYHFTDYANKEKFAEIYHLFSRDAVASGSLEKFAGTLPKKRGYLSLNDAFLEELDKHRDTLARAFKNRNPDLDGDTLTEITQRTLDRLVFIRFLEDKLIHSENLVANFGDKGTAWQDFVAASRKLDGIYNGIIFKAHAILDVPGFKVDDAAFAGICEELSPANTAYNFNYISIQILGSIYERFLGKVIVTTDKRARVEEKPEVRKAGGVYYTPDYIVRYIVENTVGKLIEGKTPAQIAEMRFADIACGSGSFLLGVFDLLLHYHRDWFNANPDKAKKAGCVQRDDGAWHLSLQQRREILLHNIYGVDIDRQAVEVAQLSLYLKLLEEETTGTAREYQMEFHETLLPSLAKNIVCGNSLIGTDILSGELFEPVEERKLNPMNFEDRFPQIFRRRRGDESQTSSGELRDAPPGQLDYTMPGVPLHGSFSYKKSKKEKAVPPPVLPESEYEGGFDAIVGNPPYIRIQTLQEISPQSVAYFSEHYNAASKGNYDIYVVFVERALGLLNGKGTLGYILPHKFFNAQYGESLRSLLSKGKNISSIVHFSDQQIFEGATTYTCLLFLQKNSLNQFRFTKVTDLKQWRENRIASEGNIQAKNVSSDEWNFGVGGSGELIQKLNRMPKRLGDVANRIFQGLVTGADSVFILQNRNGNTFYSEGTAQEHKIEKSLMHPLCKGSVNLRRYQVDTPTKSILFPYELISGRAQLISKGKFQKDYPLAWAYLLANRSALEGRERGKWKHDQWYALGRSQNLSEMEQEKLLTPSIANRASFTYDAKDYFYFVGSGGGGGGGYGVTLKKETGLAYPFVLGLLNSKLLDFYLKSVSSPFQHGYYAYNRQYIERLPIASADKARHDKMVSLVEQMLAAKPQLARAQSDKDKDFYTNKCAALDRQIDALVYELYGLTPDEIKIVENC